MTTDKSLLATHFQHQKQTPNSETSTIANLGDVPLLPPEPYLYYNYPKECLDFHFDVWNETDNFIRVLKVNHRIRSDR